MSKPIDNQKIVEIFNKIADYQLPSSVVQEDIKQLVTLLTEQEACHGAAGKTIWRAIMQNRFTKYVSAAMVFVVVFICGQFMPASKLNAAELLTKVSKNMQKYDFIKSVNRSYVSGKDEPVETTIIYANNKDKQVFMVYDKGYIHQLDYKKMIWQVYRPEDNALIVNVLKGEWADSNLQVKEVVEKLTKEGFQVRETDQLYNGVPFTQIEFDEVLGNIVNDPNRYMSKMMMGSKIVKTIKTKLMINRDEMFLSKSDVCYYDPEDQLIVTEKSEAGPVDSVPVDIYELGVPKDVKIINKVPDERVKEIRRKISESQDCFLGNYIAVQIETKRHKDQELLVEGMVIYCKGKKLRVDVFRRGHPSEQKKPIPVEVTNLLKDSLSRLEPFISGPVKPRSIRIYDGLWQHKIEEQNGNLTLCTPQRRPDGDEFCDDDIGDFGWRKLWWLNEPEWIYDDEFSQENGLVGMELTAQSQWGRLPKRLVLYVDPNKDYLFRRYVEEELVDAPWQVDKSWFDADKNKDKLTERVRVHDVIEYGKTTAGQWYPKVITVKGYDDRLNENAIKNDFDSVNRIYLLQENPDIPDEIFDPKLLSDVVSQK